MGSLDAMEKIEESTEAPEDIEVTWTQEQADEAELMGWIPPERSKKMPEGKKYFGPQEYMERNPLYKRVKDMESTLSQVMTHNSKVNADNLKRQETDFNKRIGQLEAEKLQALNEADHEKVIKIDKELRSAEPPVDAGDPLFDTWVKGNAWYKDNKFLSIEADNIGEKYARMGMQGNDLYDAVEKHIKKAYPDEFKNPNRDRASSVEGGSNKSASNKSTVKLTDDERTIFNNFKRMGVFKEKGAEEKYVQEVMAQRD